jgi:predicted peptidase
VKQFLFLFLFLIAGLNGYAQSENQIPIEFKPGIFVLQDSKTGKTDSLPYQLVLPDNYQPQNSYPLMVLLHGSGERGNNNQAQLKHFLPLINNGAVRKKYPFIFLIPQCPAGNSWSQYLWKRDSSDAEMPTTPTKPLELLHALTLKLETQYKVDAKHKYISGLSMGSFGTLEFISFYPKEFIAAVAICGGAHPGLYKKISKTPTWIFHGDSDPVVKVALSRKLVEAIRDLDKEIIYTELQGVRHDSWVAAYSNPLWLDWLWAQK